MSIMSPYPDVEIPDVSVYDYIFGSLSEDERQHVAVIDGSTGDSLTFGALQSYVDSFAHAIAALGATVGEVIALYAPNGTDFVAAFHGLLRAGATVTTVNTLYTADDIVEQLGDSGARMIVTVSALLGTALDAAAAAGISTDRIIVLDGAAGYTGGAELFTAGRDAPHATFDPRTHVAVLPYSSGTTGRPKGVMLTHRNLVANVAQGAPVFELSAADTILAVLPFFHIYGMTVLMNMSLRSRARIVTMPRFDLVEFLRIIRDQRCTYAFIAPPIAVALAKHPLIDDYDLSSLKVVLSGAAALDEKLGAAVESRLGVRMLQGYGMTEMSPVSHVIPRSRSDVSIGSIGVALPNVESRLLDIISGEDVEVPQSGMSEAGELLVRGPHVMAGYLHNPAATIETLDADGFLHTGDIARVDSNGVMWIVDRLKELIKYKGYQVAPAELEALLLSHPAIADVAVIGVPDDEAGEVPKAFVVRHAQLGDQLTADQTIAFVAAHASPHKKVRLVEFVDAIPKSASGKILRKDLRAREAAAASVGRR